MHATFALLPKDTAERIPQSTVLLLPRAPAAMARHASFFCLETHDGSPFRLQAATCARSLRCCVRTPQGASRRARCCCCYAR